MTYKNVYDLCVHFICSTTNLKEDDTSENAHDFSSRAITSRDWATPKEHSLNCVAVFFPFGLSNYFLFGFFFYYGFFSLVFCGSFFSEDIANIILIPATNVNATKMVLCWIYGMNSIHNYVIPFRNPFFSAENSFCVWSVFRSTFEYCVSTTLYDL